MVLERAGVLAPKPQRDIGDMYLELARVSGSDSKLDDVWFEEYQPAPVKGMPSNPSKLARWCLIAPESTIDSFEPDTLQSIRFLGDLTDSILTPQVRLMKYLCQWANQSERFYHCDAQDQWLRTVIVLWEPSSEQVWHKKDSNSTWLYTIRSNVVPSQAYLSQARWDLERTTQATTSSAYFSRGFFPASLLHETHQETMKSSGKYFGSLDLVSLAKKVLKWKERTENGCDLTRQLNERHRDDVFKFWFITIGEVEFEKVLGTGSEGSAQQILWHRATFVMKVFVNESIFCNELEILLELGLHPNIVHCFGYSITDSLYGDDREYRLYMEFLESDLYVFLFEQARLPITGPSYSPFAFKVKLDILFQIAKAMEHIHEKGVVHGDLKPENILVHQFQYWLDSDATYCVVKVADFGSARRVSSFVCHPGTTTHAAPEVLNWRKKKSTGEKHLRLAEPRKIDVYSFGIVAYEVLTGLLKMEEKYVPEIELKGDLIKGVRDGDLRPRLDALQGKRYPSSLLILMQACWTKNPAGRPSFSEIRNKIQSLMDATAINMPHDQRTASTNLNGNSGTHGQRDFITLS